jgi:hypothetical protein
MNIGYVVLAIFAWHIVGGITCIAWACSSILTPDGWELCNPYWFHLYHKVNWFGAVMGSLFYTFLCPLGAVIYWFYKLCTVGRG